MDDEYQLRELLVRSAQQMLAAGLVTGTSGNLSAREPGSERILVTPSGVDYDALRPEDLAAVDLDGRSPEGSLVPSVDTPSHVAIYRARPQVNGVVHTHSPYAAAFSMVGESIPPLLLEAAGYLGGAVRLMEYLPPGSPAAAGRLAATLAGQRAILLPNHGVVAVGETLPSAFHAAIAVEEGARVAWIARQLGRPRPVPDDDVAWMNDFIHRRYGQR
jgi:ribulose-5-phosphate 4-epimerase/fuculose-1-phosphate aldolase